MGLGPSLLHGLVQLRRSGHFGDKPCVVEIGTQQLSDSFLRERELICDAYAAFGLTAIPLGDPVDPLSTAALEPQSDRAPPSAAFWRSLGFSYTAIDYEPGEATLGLDLNSGRIVGILHDAADLVVNCGTTEHVANQDNAFRVIHDLTKPGGIMFHEVPCNGYLTHGLLSYSPQMFWRLCRQNDYEVVYLRVHYDGEVPIPAGIRISNDTFRGAFRMFSPPMPQTVSGFSITAILCKKHRKDYVTPLDVAANPSGA